MIEPITQVAVGGIFALLVLREVFQYMERRRGGQARSRDTDKISHVHSDVSAVIARLDRMVERLDDIGHAVKETKRQSQISCEWTERMVRSMSQLEESVLRVNRSPMRPAEKKGA